ncbi:MAG TPA: NAD(+) diphosphatase [Sphingomicrobium sp.]
MPPEPFFNGAGLDRADALRSDEAAVAALAERDDACELKWADGLPQLTEDGRLAWQPVTNPQLFLGLDCGSPRFSAIREAEAAPWAAFPSLAILTDEDAPLFAAALSLARWHSRHRFCANCGHSTDSVRAGWSRRCPSCSAEHFPRVDPVVIMLAEFDGQLLLGRQPHYPPDRFSALAGFVEVGESVEDAVRRELHEEAGIRVRDVRYVASQPWPFPSSLMIGCTATAESRELTIDTTELEDARWFSRAEIAAALRGGADAAFQPPPKAAIARTLLERWLAA